MEKPDNLLDPKVLAKFSNLYMVAKAVVEGFISGLHKSPFKGFSVEFSEHREYSPGDDLRYLDWKVFGRTDRLYIRVFKEETNVKSYILLDTSASMQYKGVSQKSSGISKLDYGILLAASLSYLMVNQKDAVGLVLFDSGIEKVINPASTTKHLHYLIENLKAIHGGGKTDLGQVMHRFAPNIKRRSLIILISDLFADREAVMKGLSHFRYKHNEVIVFHILDKSEILLPFRGNFEFVDSETGERIRADPLFIQKAYSKTFDEFLNFYRKNCADRNIAYAQTTTETPFDYFLYNYLQKRTKYK